MYQPRTVPFEHQVSACADARDKQGWAWLMEMGTGKSKVAIDDFGDHFTRQMIDCVVVLCPKAIMRNWVDGEIPLHCNVDYSVKMWRPGGGNSTQQRELERLLQTADHLRILVMNTEALGSSSVTFNYLMKFVRSGRCAMYVDESTQVKNHKAKRTQAVMQASSRCVLRRIMSGQPVANSPMDLYSQFEVLQDAALGCRTFSAFQARYADIVLQNFGGRRVRTVAGYRNLDDLSERVGRLSTRVKKEDCLDLPDKVFVTRFVEPTRDQQRVYDELKRWAFTSLGEETVTIDSALLRYLRLQQVLCGFVTDDSGLVQDIDDGRIPALMEGISETTGDMVIWSRFRHCVPRIVAAVEELLGPGSCAQFHGGNVQTRDQEQERFKTDPRCRVMVATEAGARGNTWVNAKTHHFHSNGFSYEVRVQSEDRSHRIGQTSKVTYIDYVVPDSVDVHVLAALKSKQDLAATIVDSPAELLRLL